MTISEQQLISLQARLDREGLQLTARSLARIHDIMDGCQVDRRAEGSQRQLGLLIRDRINRDP